MQDKQSAEELGVRQQTLARKAFPSSNSKEFDRLLKWQYYQALLPECESKLGAPKSTETFGYLYFRACALERHDQQFNARAGIQLKHLLVLNLPSCQKTNCMR